ncbi:uncharacterized protein LOC113280711 [Papaver somniferum]|uniref:uncharacterized protein LOC113280711 n=1 Tax=Papaver somniferum TaxID=3469 RepID=UPI000E7058A7|nr:uncharacterized protein LOC113280711 [Papaver somniferum]
MQSPRVSNWEAALRVLRYLKGHPGQGILLGKDSALQLTAYCDSDWASCPLSRRSLTVYLIFLGGLLISWKKKKQHTISVLMLRPSTVPWLILVSGAVITSHVRTTAQLAYIFTKALGRPQFEQLLCKLGIRDLHAPN